MSHRNKRINTEEEETQTPSQQTTLPTAVNGHLQAAIKVERALVKTNHHVEYLTKCFDNQRPPRTLIPTINPQVPVRTTDLIIKWTDANIAQGLIYTKILKEYWTERQATLEAERTDLSNKIKAKTTEEQWQAVQNILETQAEEQSRENRHKTTPSRQMAQARGSGSSTQVTFQQQLAGTSRQTGNASPRAGSNANSR